MRWWRCWFAGCVCNEFLSGLVLGACFMELRWEYHYALRWVRFLPRVSRKGFTQTFNIAMSNNNNTQLAALAASMGRAESMNRFNGAIDEIRKDLAGKGVDHE